MVISQLQIAYSIELQQFLCFVTGTSSLACVDEINVHFDAVGGEIFPSTCTKSLHLPEDVGHYDDFKIALQVAIMDNGASFNTM